MDCDMNHKRKRPKQRRAGCLLCKPNKLGKGMEKKLGHRGFGKLRKDGSNSADLAPELLYQAAQQQDTGSPPARG